MEKANIVGIVLVQNEEYYIHRVLTNIRHFCDEIIVADNQSIDNTAEQVQLFIEEHPDTPIHYHNISHPRESHTLIEHLAGTNTWVFAVDGDEIYDPIGLAVLKQQILEGVFNDWWVLFGNVLHCVEVNVEDRYARGYLAPPCRSMTKLYNFSAIRSWRGPCPERLHGGEREFKPGYDKSLRNELYKENVWEDSIFRCLHLCFLERSSLDMRRHGALYSRKNISDKNLQTPLGKIVELLMTFIGKKRISSWKQQKYMRGNIVNKNVEVFFSTTS